MRRALPSFSLAFLALPIAFFATACSSNGGGGGADGTDSGVADTNGSKDVGSGADTDPGDTNDDCTEDPADRPAGSACLRNVNGTAQDLTGKPLADLVISVCGAVCYYSKTDAKGAFQAHVGKWINHDHYAVLVHGRPDFASVYVKLPAPGAGDNVVMPQPVVVTKYDAIGPALPADGAAGSTIVAGDVTLKIPDGTQFELDVEDVANGAPGRLFRSAKWTATTPPDFAAAAGAGPLYALAPFDVKFCKSAPCAKGDVVNAEATIPNSTGLAAGAAVEFYELDTDLFGTPFNAANYKVVSTGKVSADGKTITTDAGQGISHLTWLGVRAK